MSFLLTNNQRSRVRSLPEVPDLKFGTVTGDNLSETDFVLCNTIQNGLFVSSQKIPMKNEVGATYQLNLAEEINSKGLNGGSVTLEYNYLRCVAGSYKSVYIDRNSELYFGKVIPNDGKLYKNNIAVQTSLLTPIDDENVSQGQDISSEQLIRNRFAYEIAGISPNRKEVKVRLKDTLKDNQDYKDQFIEFKSDISNTVTYKTSAISYVGSEDSSIIYGREDNMFSSTQFTSLVDSAKVNENKLFVNIPKFFVTAEREITTITVTKEYFQEPMPTYTPTMQQSQTSEFGQWTYFTDYTGGNNSEWKQIAEGLSFDVSGNPIYPVALTNGMPLDMAADSEKLADNTGVSVTESLIPSLPISENNPGIEAISGSVSGGDYYLQFRYSTSFINWFDDNVSGKFFHPTYGSARLSQNHYGENYEGSLFQYIADKYEVAVSELQEGTKGIATNEFDENGLTPEMLNSCLIEMLSQYLYVDSDSPSYFRDVEHTETITEYEYAPLRSKLTNYKLLNAGIQNIGLPYDGPVDWVETFSIADSPEQYAKKYGINYEYLNSDIKEIQLVSRKRDIRDLSYYALVGRSSLHLIVNKRRASNDMMLLKFHNPLSGNVRLGTGIFFVREVMDHQSYDVDLQDFIPPPLPRTILKLPAGDGKNSNESFVRPRSTEYQSYDDLLLVSSSLSKDIERDIVSGSINEVKLNIDYSNLDNFIRFSSARRRLENFKTKLSTLELYDAYSQSIAGTYYDTGYLGNAANTVVENAGSDARKWEIASSEVINSFDGYEKYLYFDSSSYVSSSAGVFYDASWPKTTNTKPYSLYEVSSSQGVEWYNKNHASASTYDVENLDRLIYHFPDHMRNDLGNEDFLKFVDMSGHHFDNLKNYLDEFGQVYKIDEGLGKGLSKQLVYSVANSFGWNLQGGYDLAKLDKYFFGKSVDPVSKETNIYASSSLEDISREIWKRIIANMPFFLKSKGTVESLRGLINCYGIPSTILRVREYGGPTITEVEPIYETSRKFTKALNFSAGQYVSSSWSTTLGLGGTEIPNSTEFRFKAASASNMTIVQGGGNSGNNWGIHLRDSGNNTGRLVFSLSGSVGNDTKVPNTEGWGLGTGTYATMSTSPLQVYNGDYWSVLLRRTRTLHDELIGEVFNTSSFGESTSTTGSGTDISPFFATLSGSRSVPFAWASHGTLLINSASAYTYGDSTYSLKMTQVTASQGMQTYPIRNPVNINGLSGVSIADYGHQDGAGQTHKSGDGTNYRDARFASASAGDTFEFSVYARTETGNAMVRLQAMELIEDGRSNTSHNSNYVGINKDWKKISHRFTVGGLNTQYVSIGLNVRKIFGATGIDSINPPVYWDNGSFKQLVDATVGSSDAYRYELIAKQWDGTRDTLRVQDNVSMDITTAFSSSFNTSYNETGSLYIGGYTTKDLGGQFSGSMMEFRLWKSDLKEFAFDQHVENPQSFVGNSLSASFEDIALRYSFNESKNHSSDTAVRDTSTDQSIPINGIATSFADQTSYTDVVDRTKFLLPKLGGIRTSANKVRIENAEYIDRIGENINLSPTDRVEISSYDRSPFDSNRVGVYFSPVDVINQDIINQISDFNFDQYLGDSRDDDKHQYRDLESLKLEYFKKYTGANNFWDYLRLLNYFDHSLFNQLETLLPARSKAVVGVLIEPNILERNKQPKNYPTYEDTSFEETIKLNEEDGGFISQSAENNYLEVTKNVTRLDREMDEDSSYDFDSENTYYQASITESIFDKPSMRDFNRVDKFGWVGRNYMTSSLTMGGPIGVFTESIAMVENQRVSTFNKKRLYIYSSKEEFLQGSASSVSFVTSSFEKLTEYSTGLRRITFEGSKNTNKTALPTIDSNGNQTYDAVTYILTNPYTLVSDARESVQLRTEFDLGNENE